MNSILVTGGAGFIGSTLCERLLGIGYRVICLDNFNDFYSPVTKRYNVAAAKKDPNYVLIEGDIRDDALLNNLFRLFNIDKVVHLAAMAGVRKSIDTPQEYVDVDIKGTVNLLEISRKYRINKFIFASSSSVYGKNPTPFREDDYVNIQVSPYATAKRSGELFCRTYSDLYNIPIICLRFFTVYGPRQRPEMAIHLFTKSIDEGKEVAIYGDGKSYRDYTYVDDIIDGIISSIELDCSFDVINLGNSYPVPLNKLINIIEQKLGKYALKRYLPAQPGDVEHTCADISRAKNLLNYNPKTDIEIGIDRFVEWYKRNKR